MNNEANVAGLVRQHKKIPTGCRTRWIDCDMRWMDFPEIFAKFVPEIN